jgi:hypothetical protein
MVRRSSFPMGLVERLLGVDCALVVNIIPL